MSIVFRCDCGKKLQVKDEAAGKTCVCPGCGDRLTIPDARVEDETRTQKPPFPRTPTSRSAPRRRPDGEDADSPPPRRKAGATAKGKQKKAQSSVPWPWIAGGAAALAVVVGVTLWLVLRKPKEPGQDTSANNTPTQPKPPDNTPSGPVKDLEMIPPDAVGFAAIQLGDWWDTPAGKKLQQQVAPLGPNDLLEQYLGAPPDNIQRVTAVLAGQAGPCTMVSTKKPVRREKVLAALVPNGKPLGEGGKTFHVGARGNAVFFFSDRHYAFGDHKWLSEFVGRAGASSQPGPLAEALRLTEKHLVVVGVNPGAAPPVQEMKKNVPPEMRDYAVLLQTHAAALTLDLDDDLKIHLAMTLADAGQATTARTQMQALTGLGRLTVAKIKESASTPSEKAIIGPMAVVVDSLLRSVKIELKQAVVEVDLQSEKGVLTEQVGLLVPAVQKVREAARRAEDSNNLKEIALGLHNYNGAFGAFPAAAICAKDGKPLLSWRVAILPFIEQGALYQQFHLNEPWDSPHNVKLVDQMPKVYASPAPSGDKAGTTHYRVFTGDQAAFPACARNPNPPISTGRRYIEFTDGTSNTLLVVVAADAVQWTRPDELPYSPQGPLPKLGTQEGGFAVAFADGAVRILPTPIEEKTLRALITPAGGEVVNLP